MGALLQARRAAARKKPRGQTFSASTYGNDPKTGYRDPGDNDRPASGIPNRFPAVAIGLNSKNLGKYVPISGLGKYKGQTLLVRVGDLGPSIPGRLDENATLARLQGLPQGDRFPTGAKVTRGDKVYSKPPKGATKVTNGLYVLGGSTPVKVKTGSPGKVKAPKVTGATGAPSTAALDSVPDVAPSSGLAEQISQRQTVSPPFTLPADPWFSSRSRIASATGATGLPSLQPEPQDNGLSAQLADAQARTEANPFLPPQSELGSVQGSSNVPDTPQTGPTKAPENKPKSNLPKLSRSPKNPALRTWASQAAKRGSFVYKAETGDFASKGLQEMAKTGRARVPATGQRVVINPRLLQFLAAATKAGDVKINAVVNGNHTAGSNHYKGNAVDIDLTSGLGAGRITSIARRFGGVRNSEGDHIHLDF